MLQGQVEESQVHVQGLELEVGPAQPRVEGDGAGEGGRRLRPAELGQFDQRPGPAEFPGVPGQPQVGLPQQGVGLGVPRVGRDGPAGGPSTSPSLPICGRGFRSGCSREASLER